MNRVTRGFDKDTDILSFPFYDKVSEEEDENEEFTLVEASDNTGDQFTSEENNEGETITTSLPFSLFSPSSDMLIKKAGVLPPLPEFPSLGVDDESSSIHDFKNLGDMFISLDYIQAVINEDIIAAKESESKEGESINEETIGVSYAMSKTEDLPTRVHLLLIHGILHLVGYDHIVDGEYKEMVNKEEEIILKLKEMGCPFP